MKRLGIVQRVFKIGQYFAILLYFFRQFIERCEIFILTSQRLIQGLGKRELCPIEFRDDLSIQISCEPKRQQVATE